MPRGGLRPGSGPKQLYRYVIKGVQYNTLADAVKKLGVTKSAICKWCKDNGRDDCFKEPIKVSVNMPKVKDKKEKKVKPRRESKKHEPAQSQTQDVILDPPKINKDSTIAEINDAAMAANMTPLDFFLSIMRNVDEDKELRIKVAYYAAPYIHPKGSEKKGKKEEQEDRAKAASKGRFAAGKPPLSLVKGTK
jgi:hypothetical protein